MLRRLPIRLKLILLAGVPVLGALILATLISRDAQHRAQSAAALGSIEDLARLSAHMSKLVQELQFERSELGLRLGLKTPEAPELAKRFAQTDEASRELTAFLAARRVATLPARLARDLGQAQQRLTRLPEERKAALSGDHDFGASFERYEAADRSLISATAALAQLSEDGELMRAISALVSTMEIKERSSQEHALLSYVFAVNEFPPGTFKQLVTLTTEEADYISVLEVNASDAVTKRFHAIWSGPEQARSAKLRKVALEAVDDQFGVDPLEWFRVQGQKIDRLRSLEVELNEAVKGAALAKVQAAEQAVRISYGLGGSVIIISALLAGWIAVGVSRSVGNLSAAAERVRADKDFKVRAVKTSDDELGQLTDAFNEMLAGIQGRDDELTSHRGNLERLVAERTTELQQSNEAMQLVLSNVEQGLAIINPSGSLGWARSRAFDDWFGVGNGNDHLAQRLAQGDAALAAWLTHGWDQVVEGFFPTEVALDQLPRRLHVNQRHYQLGYKAMLDGEKLEGVLLVVSDVTAEMEQLRRDAEQRELIGIFEHLMRDRGGTVEFFQECESLVAHILGGANRDRQSVLRALHTLKGNAGTFGVTSVAEAAHGLETLVIGGAGLPDAADLTELSDAWRAFSERLGRLLGTDAEPVVEVALSELEALMKAAQTGAPGATLSQMLARLRLERAALRLKRIGDQARSLAQRLGKAALQVEVNAQGDVRFERQRWSSFWAAFIHAIRNALDHGIESAEERLAAGESAHGKLTISVRGDAQSITVELSDDGRGIDFDKVRTKAKASGLPHGTEAELLEALFSEGFSTADQTTELSGRGMGMSALREAARGIGGVVTLHSRPGQGTTLRARFPGLSPRPRPGLDSATFVLAPLLLSFQVSLLATLLASVLGVALAGVLAQRRFPGAELLDAVLNAPLVLPPTVLGYYLLILLGRESALGHAYEAVTGSSIVFTRTGATCAAALAALPFVARSARAALQDVDQRFAEAAATLGASPLRAFRRVLLPLASRGIWAGITLGFARSLGDFGVTLMVAGNIPGRTQTASLAIYDAIQAGRDQQAGGLAAVLSALAVAALYAVSKLSRRATS